MPKADYQGGTIDLPATIFTENAVYKLEEK
jgi:hypothetical protein